MTMPARTLPALTNVLYRRTQQVFLPQPVNGERTGEPLLQLGEMLGHHGLVMTRALYAALDALSDAQVQGMARELVQDALAQYGAHRQHVPLFRNFPQNTPQDTYVFYLRRILALRGRDPGVPCALDNDDRPWGLSRLTFLTPPKACTYGMFDPEVFNGCPICHRRVGPPDAEHARQRDQLQQSQEQLHWLKRLDLGTDLQAAVRQELRVLLQKTSPLNPQERDDLRVLLAAAGVDALEWLPEKVPQRETMALILGTLLLHQDAQEGVLALLDTQVRTATDLLRVLDAAGGGDAGLTGPNRAAKLPRRVRRAVLARLNALDAQNLAEDLGRHPSRWKKMGEVLHPFEFARLFPNVAVAFAALRGTTPQDDALGALLSAAPQHLAGLTWQPERAGVNRSGPREPMKTVAQVEQEAQEQTAQQFRQVYYDWKAYAGALQRNTEAALAARQKVMNTRSADPSQPHPPRLRFTRWAGRVEKALTEQNIPELTRLLAQRPGELGRRLDALLRRILTQPEQWGAVMQAVQHAAPRLNTPILLLLRSHLQARSSVWPTRLVFPKASAQSFSLPDRREVLPAELTAPIVDSLQAELLARAAALPRFPLAVLDERLRDLPVPFAERETARALVTLARGAKVKLPAGRFARLFVHWMEHEQQRLDIDLSVAMYDANWRSAGKCDFTHLRYARTGAVHSGDLTSAPAPLGSSEFIDLDVETLQAHGVRYVVMSVLSYNGVPFEQMAEAFAGYMLREHHSGPEFDARTVEQRFDLRGRQQVSLPLALDIVEGTLHWLDTMPQARTLGEVVGHQVAVYSDAMGLAARRVIESASVRARPTLWEVAALHASRASEVYVQREDGTLSVHRRHERGAADFLNALSTEAGEPVTSLPDRPALGFFLHRAQTLVPGSIAVALRDSVIEEQEVERRTYAQALSELTPIEPQ